MSGRENQKAIAPRVPGEGRRGEFRFAWSSERSGPIGKILFPPIAVAVFAFLTLAVMGFALLGFAGAAVVLTVARATRGLRGKKHKPDGREIREGQTIDLNPSEFRELPND